MSERQSKDAAAKTSRWIAIDPEDAEQLERLALAWRSQTHANLGDEPMSFDAYRMQAALREFANPTPPKPDEPTGLGAVVEDADGLRWVRHADGRWGSPQQFDTRTWAAIDAVRVLSHGVTEEDQ